MSESPPARRSYPLWEEKWEESTILSTMLHGRAESEVAIRENS